MTYEGMYLIYNTRSKRVSFQKKALDDRTHLVIGQVNEGIVNGQPITYWLTKMEAQKHQVAKA
jgi:hypothetical protein